jgi:hypothetical protein
MMNMTEDETEVTMEFFNSLKDAVVGHRVVATDLGQHKDTLVLTLDNGKRIRVSGIYDCCAYGDIDSVTQKLSSENVITNLSLSDEGKSYGNFTIFLLTAIQDREVTVYEIDGSASEGSGYYSYGWELSVEDIS